MDNICEIVKAEIPVGSYWIDSLTGQFIKVEVIGDDGSVICVDESGTKIICKDYKLWLKHKRIVTRREFMDYFEKTYKENE
jgi:hypothetical protein